MTEIILDAAGVRRFVSPTGGDDPIVLALRRRQYLRTVRGLAATHDKLLEDCPDLALRTGFSDVLSYVGSSPSRVQQQVLGYPTVAFWVDVVLDLLERRAHVMFPDLHIQTHLESFGRVGLAIAHFCQDSFECNTRLDSAAGISPPGTSSYYSLVSAKPFELVRVQYKNGDLTAQPLEGDKEYALRRKRIPRVANFELNTLDEDLRLPGRYDFEFDLPLRDADLIRWQSPLEESWNWISASDNLLGSEIDTAVRAIVPVRSQNPEVHISATFKEAPGVIALSWTPDTPVLAEALVHEYHHGKLNTLFAADVLITGPTKEAIFYSPWRPDPRPLVGLLHGVFAFHSVVDFWIKFLNAKIPLLHERRLRQRLCLLCRQTKEAVETLASEGMFTKTGSILIESLLQRIGEFDSLISTDQEVLRRVERVMKDHKEHWEKEHGRLAQRTTSPLLRPITDPEQADTYRLLTIEDLADQFPSEDPIIEDLTNANDQGRLDSALENWVQMSTDASEPMLEVLARAHAAYVAGKFDEAGSGYGLLLQQYPASRYFWQCFGHCLRHLNKIDLGTTILTNLTRLSAEARSHEPDIVESLNERACHAMNLLAATEGAVA
jgi:HEXXH motif-containing protein